MPSNSKLLSDAARRRATAAAPLLISAMLIGAVATQLDLTQVAALALRPHALAWMTLALLLFNLSRLAGARRLHLLLAQAGIRIGHWDNLRLTYAAMFLNLLLPGGISGDGYKIAVLARRCGAPVATLFGITVADRLSGLLVLLAMLSLLLPFAGLPWAAMQVWAFGGALLLAVLLATRLLHARLPGMTRPRATVFLALGAAVQGLQLACMAALLAYQQVPPARWLGYLALFLVSSILTVLPLSWGGLGVRELSFIAGARLLDCDPLPGVVAASAFFLVTVVSALPGAAFLLPAAAPGRQP